jgi:hypothetical protein
MGLKGYGWIGLGEGMGPSGINYFVNSFYIVSISLQPPGAFRICQEFFKTAVSALF